MDIIELLERRDEKGLSLLKGKYADYCYGIIFRPLEDRELSEEALSDVWLDIWNAIPPARPARLRPYLAKTARNIARSSELLRLNLDGSERITILKPVDLVKKGGIGCRSPHICNGVYSVGLFYLDENGVDQCDYYYTTLDSGLDTMEQMVPCGVAQTVGDKMTVMDHEDNKMYLWDPKTNETTFLSESTGRGYYGETEVSNSPTDEQWANFEKVTEQFLRFYNWEFEFLGEVKLDYPGALESYNPICGESHERIYLADSMDHVPRYYIEKADLGTENITIHKLNLPDDLERMLDEEGGVGILFGS